MEGKLFRKAILSLTNTNKKIYHLYAILSFLKKQTLKHILAKQEKISSVFVAKLPLMAARSIMSLQALTTGPLWNSILM